MLGENSRRQNCLELAKKVYSETVSCELIPSLSPVGSFQMVMNLIYQTDCDLENPPSPHTFHHSDHQLTIDASSSLAIKCDGFCLSLMTSRTLSGLLKARMHPSFEISSLWLFIEPVPLPKNRGLGDTQSGRGLRAEVVSPIRVQ